MATITCKPDDCSSLDEKLLFVIQKVSEKYEAALISKIDSSLHGLAIPIEAPRHWPPSQETKSMKLLLAWLDHCTCLALAMKKRMITLLSPLESKTFLISCSCNFSLTFWICRDMTKVWNNFSYLWDIRPARRAKTSGKIRKKRIPQAVERYWEEITK